MTTDPTMKALEQEAERRRRQAAEKAKEPLPSFIKTIETTTVTYTVNPQILPFPLVDPQQLKALLTQKYRLRYKPPAIDPVELQSLGIDATNLTEERLMSMALSMKSPTLLFVNGRYPTGPNTFVAIEEVAFTDEKISATVNGVSEVAEVVIADAFNLFWDSTGTARRWDTKETQDEVQLKSHRTTTTVDLGADARNVLNPSVRRFLDDNVDRGEKFAPRMIAKSRYDSFKPSDHIISTWSLEELVTNVHAFDTTTGRPETSTLRFKTMTRDERGRGIIRVSSELPFDDHLKLIEAIVAILQPTSSNHDRRGS